MSGPLDLQHFGDGIWIADGPSVHFVFGQIPTRMIVVKLRDGSLWVNSPVTVSDAAFDQVEALGPVRYLIAPTRLHVWRLEQWHVRFPQAQIWGPDALEETPPSAWADDLDQARFRGNALIEETEFLHKPSHTLIMTDFIQKYAAINGDVVGNVVKRFAGILDGGVPLDIRLSFTKRKLARASLEKLLSWDFDKVILAHGDCVEHDGKAFVENAFRWLNPTSPKRAAG